ncbi:MAG: hypothetical protein AAF618_08675, partial [Pseudomonadota bacterium]
EIYLPPLMRARIFLETERYAEAATAAAPVVVAMDQPAFLSDELRIEALHVLTEALAYGDNFAQAEPVARGFVHAVETHLGPEVRDYWIRDALVLRAWIISVTGASDAKAVRAALLARYSDLPGATREEYFELWNLDLRARREDGTQDPALLADARYVYEGLEAWDGKDPEAFHETYRMLGLIFADNADYARAEPIIARHAALLAERAPGSVTHFWTRQNLVAIRDLSGDHVSALRTARLALADLDALPGGGGKDYAEVRSALERAVYSASLSEGDAITAGAALQRAYIAAREVFSANHPLAQELAGYIDPAYVDPVSFPYAAEVGLDAARDMALTEFGEGVIAAFFDGNFAFAQEALRQAAMLEKAPPEMIALNRAFLHALLGETEAGLAALAEARAILRQPGGSAVIPANSAAPDLAEAMLWIVGRNWQPEQADAALERLERRQDLTPIHASYVQILRATQAVNADFPARSQRIYDEAAARHYSLAGITPYGMLMGLGIFNIGLELGDYRRTRPFGQAYRAELQAAGGRALALAALDIFELNDDAGLVQDDAGLDRMAFRIAALSRLLPAEHQWTVAIRVRLAFSLAARGDYLASARAIFEAVELYRQSPEHRSDVVASLQVDAAYSLWSAGQPELAQTIIAEAWAARDPEGWQPSYFARVAGGQSYALRVTGALEEALAVTQGLISNARVHTRMDPISKQAIWLNHGQTLADMRRFDEALTAFDTALAALPNLEVDGGQPAALILFERARIHRMKGEVEEGFASAMAAASYHFDRYDSAGDASRNADVDVWRAIQAARAGWDFHRAVEGGQ